jgi:hypothetical protein
MVHVQRSVVLIACLPALLGQGQPDPNQRRDARIWVGRHLEIEEYLKAAECTSMEWLGPHRFARCTLSPGGPVGRMVWKPLPPGVYRGFRESYLAEIAAYEVDKLLGLDMVPPTVERQLAGSTGAAQLWVEDVVPWNPDAPPGELDRKTWAAQGVRARMFDDLIGNSDRNARNILHDAAWNMVLIDHSRAFGRDTTLPQKLNRIDEGFWAKIDGLTRRQIDKALGPWLKRDAIEAIVGRRERMRVEIGRLTRRGKKSASVD